MLKGKTIVLGITGCIAAYKSCELVSRLRKDGATVKVIMTQHAMQFVQPLSFETLSGNRVITDLFDRDFDYDVKHVSLAKEADLFVIAPATANVIGKLANGLADDMLTTTYMACKAPKLICPAMNTNMYEDDHLEENLNDLKKKGAIIIEPVEGRLACGDVGKGKMAEPVDIYEEILDILMPKTDYENLKVLVTAGSTEENVDGVRFISNHSSGKMGIALAAAAADRGADVNVIYGRIKVSLPDNIQGSTKVKTTEDMYDAVMEQYKDADIIIMAAAPADYRMKRTFANKVKSKELVLELEKTPDISLALGKVKENRKLVIFSAETENLIQNAQGKLEKKNADLVVANDVTKEGAGFGVDTNIATIIAKDGKRWDYELMLKRDLADKILDIVLTL